MPLVPPASTQRRSEPMTDAEWKSLIRIWNSTRAAGEDLPTESRIGQMFNNVAREYETLIDQVSDEGRE
jgi:hypothetical protein